jgi:hypothetical protein
MQWPAGGLAKLCADNQHVHSRGVWLYHGNSCPMCKDLREWCDELKGRALMNERFDFSPVYLRRTLWKLMIEVDRFYDRECTPDMFERGHGPIPWPNHTKMSSILSKFLDGDEMKSRLLPEEWSVEFYRKKVLNNSAVGHKRRGGGYQGTGGGGQGGGTYQSPSGYQGRGGGYQGSSDEGHGNGGYSYQQGYGCGSPPEHQAPPQGDKEKGKTQQDCYPKIKQMMEAYWKKF